MRDCKDWGLGVGPVVQGGLDSPGRAGHLHCAGTGGSITL